MNTERKRKEEFGQEIGLKIAKGIAIGFAIFFAVVIGGFALGWVIKYLWNETLVPLFAVPSINFWQAFALFILAKIFFGFGGSGHHGRGKRNKERHSHGKRWWDKDKRVEPVTEANTDADFQAYWRQEGKAAYEAYLAGEKESKTDGPKE